MSSDSGIDPPASTAFRVDLTVGAEVVQLAVAGDIDFASIGMLEHRARGAIDEYRPAHVIVDLQETSFMDSLGLRFLLRLHWAARDDGFRLSVVRGPVAVQRAIEVAGLDRLLDIVDDPGQALDAVRQG